MKRKRKIRWSESVGARQFQTSIFGTERSLTGELSLFVLCTLLFFGTACGMLRSVFEWEVLTVGILFRVFFVTVLVSGLLEATMLLKSTWAIVLRGSMGPVGLLGFAFYFFRAKKGEAILSGMQAIATSYLSRWNAYYKTAYRCATGEVDEILTAVRFWVTVLCFLLVWWGRIRKRPMIPVVAPLLVLVAELLIGWAPTGLSLFTMAVGVCLSNATGYRGPEFTVTPDKQGENHGRRQMRQFFWVPVALFLTVLCFAVKAAGTSFATEAVRGGEEKLKQKSKEMLQTITEWTGWQEVNVAKSVEKAIEEFLNKKGIKTKNKPESNFARLDNSKPEYDEVAVLKVVLDNWQRFGAYLIGFYADAYEDGVWDTDVEAFEAACKKAGFEPETVANGLLSLGADRVAMYYGEEFFEEASEAGYGRNSGMMQYAKANLVKVYVPYFSKVTAEGVRAEGDSRYVKDKGLTKVPFAFWNYKLDDLMTMVHLTEKMISDAGKQPWELWYEDYVTENYLNVPEGFTQVKNVAEEIRDSEVDFFRVEGESAVNIDRLNAAYQVADWMRNNTSYSLELPELPEGSDPIEYFLGTSRKGYCMHYASASVMLLRELGVPARYVSGYVVGRFERNPNTLKYEAVVLDSAAHAWVEIYLEGFGWVPVEVTNGYSVLTERTQVIERTEYGGYHISQEKWPGSNKDETWVDMRPFATPKPTPTPAPTPTPSVKDEKTPTPTPGEGSVSQTGGVDKPELTGGEDTSKQGKENPAKKATKPDLSINPVVLLFLLLGICSILFILRPLLSVLRRITCALEERGIYKKTKHRGNRLRIKLWNRMLYRKLYAKGKIRKKYMWDTEYEEVLKKYSRVLHTEERERYMTLVKAAAFSMHEFTDEDAEFCKQVYHKVLYESKKRKDEA